MGVLGNIRGVQNTTMYFREWRMSTGVRRGKARMWGKDDVTQVDYEGRKGWQVSGSPPLM